MTRRPIATTPKKKPESPAPANPPVSPTEPVIHMRPRRGLFFLLLVIFVIWIGFLVTLYFKTVYHKTDVHEETPQHAVP
jgi:hypothetical protein